MTTSALLSLVALTLAPAQVPTPAESARNVAEAAAKQQAAFSKDLTAKLAASDDSSDIWQAVASHTLLEVEINPEMRVKVAPGPAKPSLIAGEWTSFFVRVENRCGATARLAIAATDLASKTGDTPDWLDVDIADTKRHSDRLSGASVEYKLLMCRVKEPGRREVRLGLDAGQGTQDLGFRGVTEILFHARKRDADQSGE